MVDLTGMILDGGGAYVLWTIGGGIIEAAIGDGERQRGSSWLESDRRSRRLEEEREKNEVLRNISVIIVVRASE